VEFSVAIRNSIPRYFLNDGVILEYMSVLFKLEILGVIYCDINRESEFDIQRTVHRDIVL
jgi:hypothetical protein